MRFWRTYGWWIVICVGMAAAAVIVPSRGEREATTPGMVHVRDTKLRHTVEVFDPNDPERARRPMHDFNEPGVIFEIEMDPTTFELMLVEGNRRRFRERVVNVAYSVGGRDWRPGGLSTRGESSLKRTERLNFKLKFYRPERVTPDIKLRRVYLVAMIDDPHGIATRFSYRVLAELGLFPLYHQYCRVIVNGSDQGVFLLIEPIAAGLRRVHDDTVAVHRRKKWNLYETYYEDNDAPSVEASLRALRRLNYRDEVPDAENAYGASLDLDGYFMYLALCSILKNGDQLDELILYEVREDPRLPAPLRVMGWDWDDIGVDGEREPRVDDPLLFSSQDAIEAAIRREPELWRGYVETLRDVLERRMTPDRIATILGEVLAERNAIDDGRPAAEQATARAARAKFASELMGRIHERHRMLSERLRQ